MRNSISQKEEKNNIISLRDVYEFFLYRWYWFLLSVALIVGGTVFYLQTVEPTYQRVATFIMKDSKSDIGAESLIVISGGTPKGNAAQKSVDIITSSDVFAPIVDKLHLDVSYRKKNLLRRQDLYKESPIEVSFTKEYTRPIAMQIELLSIIQCRVTVGNQVFTGKIGDTLSIAKEKIVISPTPKLSTAWIGKSIEVSRISPELATQKYKSTLSASALEDSELLTVIYRGTSIQRSDDILCALIDSYNDYCAKDKQRLTHNTARFLEERINAVSSDLEGLSDELNSYGLNNTMTSIDENMTASPSTGKIRDEAVDLESRLALGKYIQSYLIDASNKGDLIPNVGGAGDIGIDAQVQSYNNLMLQRNRLIENSGKNNPVVMNVETTLAATRAGITNSINSYLNSLQIKLKQVRVQEQRAQSTVTSMQGAYGYYRQKKIKEALYSLLLKRQEENSLKMTITDPVARLVEQPANGAAPSPNALQYLVAASLAGILIPVLLWWLLISLDSKVRNRKDIEENTTLNILGEIPAYEADKNSSKRTAVSRKGNDIISEAFRVLCAHLSFVFGRMKVVMLTSTTSAEGKSFISMNMAATLAMSGKRVILVDLDLRKPVKELLVETTQETGVSDYLSGRENDLSQLIIASKDDHFPDVLPAGKVTNNPTELLLSNRLDAMVNELKKSYDCILIDSVPAVGIADVLTANRVADLTIYVIRERMLDRRFLSEIENMHQEGKLINMHVVLNNCQFFKNNYYGYYGHNKYYGYGYTYGYTTKKSNHGKKNVAK